MAGDRLEQAYPVTVTLGDGATAAYVALHVIVDWEQFPHGYAVFDVEDEGRALRQRSSVAFDPELEGSSHHGGTLVEASEETYWLSYLTDYGNRRGGAVLRYRVRSDGSLEALPGGPVITGVTDGRQLIAAPIAAAAGSSSGDPSPDSSVHGQEQRTAPSLPACDDRVALTAADAWSGELGQDMTVCLDMDLDAGELVRAKALVETPSTMAGFTMETWGPNPAGALERALLLTPTVGLGSPPVPMTWAAAGAGTHTLLLRNYWSFEHPERVVAEDQLGMAWTPSVGPMGVPIRTASSFRPVGCSRIAAQTTSGRTVHESPKAVPAAHLVPRREPAPPAP